MVPELSAALSTLKTWAFLQVCLARPLKLRLCKILSRPEKQLRHHGSGHFCGIQVSTNKLTCLKKHSDREDATFFTLQSRASNLIELETRAHLATK